MRRPDIMVQESLSTMETFFNVYNDIKSRAVSVFRWKGLSDFFNIDSSYVERCLYNSGAVAFAYDEIADSWHVGMFTALQTDTKGRPTRIRIRGNGSTFEKGEFVILYDSQSRVPLFPIIREKCRRYAEVQRSIDVNVHQQKTPRITVVPEDRLLSTKNMYAQADNYADTIVGASDSFDMATYNQFLNPAPAVFPALNEYRHDLYNEMQGLIGITSVQADRKDRHVVDEVRFSNGGNFQSRFNRYTPREEFCTEMEKRGILLEVEFYDGMPYNWKGVDEDVDTTNDYAEIFGNSAITE